MRLVDEVYELMMVCSYLADVLKNSTE